MSQTASSQGSSSSQGSNSQGAKKKKKEKKSHALKSDGHNYYLMLGNTDDQRVIVHGEFAYRIDGKRGNGEPGNYYVKCRYYGDKQSTCRVRGYVQDGYIHVTNEHEHVCQNEKGACADLFKAEQLIWQMKHRMVENTAVTHDVRNNFLKFF